MSFLFEVFFDVFVYLFDGFGAVCIWLLKGCRTELQEEFSSSHAVRNQTAAVIGWSLLFLLVLYLMNS
jgi:hypothetical protein